MNYKCSSGWKQRWPTFSTARTSVWKDQATQLEAQDVEAILSANYFV
jgi:hypothetical protein